MQRDVIHLGENIYIDKKKIYLSLLTDICTELKISNIGDILNENDMIWEEDGLYRMIGEVFDPHNNTYHRFIKVLIYAGSKYEELKYVYKLYKLCN